MAWVSFDVLRTFGLSGVMHIKPEDWLRQRDLVVAADGVLFPEYWQVNALHYGWRKRLFPSPASYHLGHDKIEMTRSFQAVAPAHVPHTLIVPATPAGIEQVLDEFSFPLVFKQVRSSMGLGVHLIGDAAALRRQASAGDVLYVQELLPIRRDLRVVYVGRGVVAAYWREAADGGFHNNVARGGRVCFDAVPPAAVELVERVAGALGVDHAGFDVAEVDGHFYLLEFNVRFGTDALNARGIRLAPLLRDHLFGHDSHPSPAAAATAPWPAVAPA